MISKKLVMVLALALVPFIIFFTYKQNQFRLVSATPGTTGEFATSTSTIRLTFNKVLDDAIDYQSFLGGDVAAVKDIYVEEKNLYVFLGLLPKGSKTTFTVNNVRSVDGRTISTIPFDFTAVYIPYDKLSKSQKELELYVTDRDIIQDPIINILPYQGDRFYISTEYTNDTADNSKPTVTVQLFLTRLDVLSRKNAAIEEYKKRAKEYVSSKGINPADYEFKYELNAPPIPAAEE